MASDRQGPIASAAGTPGGHPQARSRQEIFWRMDFHRLGAPGRDQAGGWFGDGTGSPTWAPCQGVAPPVMGEAGPTALTRARLQGLANGRLQDSGVAFQNQGRG